MLTCKQSCTLFFWCSECKSSQGNCPYLLLSLLRKMSSSQIALVRSWLHCPHKKVLTVSALSIRTNEAVFHSAPSRLSTFLLSLRFRLGAHASFATETCQILSMLPVLQDDHLHAALLTVSIQELYSQNCPYIWSSLLRSMSELVYCSCGGCWEKR